MIRGRSHRKYWGVVLDAADPPALARFYAALMGWHIHKEEPEWVTLAPPEGVAYLAVQAQVSPEFTPPTWPAQAGRQQMMLHLDVEVDDLEAAVADATALGATVAHYQPQDDVRVLLDPAGHPFCLYLDSED